MSRENELAKNTLILSFGTFLPKVVATITLPLITGYLTTAEYGTYDLIVTLVALLLPAVTLQIQSAAFRFLIVSRDNKQESRRIITNILFFTSAVSLVAVIVFLFALNSFQTSLKFAIILYFFSDIILVALRQITRGLGDNFNYALEAVLNSIIMLIMTAIQLLIFNSGLLGVLIALTSATFVSLAFLIIREKIWHYFDIKLLSISEIKKLLGYSWPMVPNNLSGWVLTMSDRLVITSFIGIEANAVYAVANKIPNLLTSFQSTFTSAWQENAALSVNDSDTKEYYSKMVNEVTSLLIGAMACLIAATPVLFSILIRGDYSAAYFQMPILYLAVFCSSISSMIGGIYIAHMKTKSVGITTSIAAILNLIIDLLLINRIGIFAGSISTFISYLFLLIYRMIDVRKIQPIEYDFRKMLSGGCILILMSVLLYQKNLVFNLINVGIAVAVLFLFNKNFIKGLYYRFMKAKK